MAEVKKGDVFSAGGTAKQFKAESGPDKDGFVVLKEVRDDKNVEELKVHIDTLKSEENWIGLEVAPASGN